MIKQEEPTAACNMDEYYKDVLTKIFHELAVKIFGTNIVGCNSYIYLRHQIQGYNTTVKTGIREYQNRIEIS